MVIHNAVSHFQRSDHAQVTPLREAHELYLTAKRAENCSPETLDKDGRYIARFIGWCTEQGIEHVHELTPQLCRKFILYLQGSTHPLTGKPLSPFTVRGYLSMIRAWTRWLEREELLDLCPFRKIRMPRTPRPRPVPLSDLEIHKLLVTARSPDGRGRRELGRRDVAIVMVLATTGLRVSELCSLDLADWQAGRRVRKKSSIGGTLRVWGKGAKERIVALPAAADAAIADYVANERGTDPGPLFLSRCGDRLTRNGVHQLLADLGRRAGVPGVHAHRFRKTFATNYVRRHGDDVFGLCALMGWESLAPAQHYVRLVAEERAAEMRMVGETGPATLRRTKNGGVG